MGWFEALVLGIVQGLTEFLPISSSAHIRIVSALVGWEDPGAAFTAVIQLGTEAAVAVYFYKDIWSIIKTWCLSLFHRPELRREPDARMGWFIIVGTLPIGILGFAFEDTIENALRNLVYIALCLIIFGAVLGIVDHLASNRKRLDELTYPHALIYGFAQSLALIPGVSRSGGTTTAGLALGYRREAAAKYSFLLAMPAVLASGLFEMVDIAKGHGPDWGPTILATIISFIVGFVTVRSFMQWISRHSFQPFVIYRICLGFLVLILLGLGVLQPYAGT